MKRRRKRQPQGVIDTLPSGALRVRVDAGIDRLTGKRLRLTEIIEPGTPNALDTAEQERQRLLRLVAERRNPQTNTTVAQMLDRYLAEWDGSDRFRKTLQGYVRNHVERFLGKIKAQELELEVLDSFYRELKRCRAHCEYGIVWSYLPSPSKRWRRRPVREPLWIPPTGWRTRLHDHAQPSDTPADSCDPKTARPIT